MQTRVMVELGAPRTYRSVPHDAGRVDPAMVVGQSFSERLQQQVAQVADASVAAEPKVSQSAGGDEKDAAVQPEEAMVQTLAQQKAPAPPAEAAVPKSAGSSASPGRTATTPEVRTPPVRTPPGKLRWIEPAAPLCVSASAAAETAAPSVPASVPLESQPANLPGAAWPPPPPAAVAGNSGGLVAAAPMAKGKLAPGKLPGPVADDGTAAMGAVPPENVVSRPEAAAAAPDRAAGTVQAPEQRTETAAAHAWPAAHLAPVVHQAIAIPAAPAQTSPAGAERSAWVSRLEPETVGQFRAETPVLQSSAGGLEVGLHSEVHGWIKVKAEMDVRSGEVSAVVLAPSAHATATLSHEIPAMQAYLAGEQVGLHRLTVERSTTDQGSDFAGDGQHRDDRREPRPKAADPTSDPSGRALVLSAAGVFAGLPSGGHLSVLA